MLFSVKTNWISLKSSTVRAKLIIVILTCTLNSHHNHHQSKILKTQTNNTQTEAQTKHAFTRIFTHFVMCHITGLAPKASTHLNKAIASHSVSIAILERQWGAIVCALIIYLSLTRPSLIYCQIPFKSMRLMDELIPLFLFLPVSNRPGLCWRRFPNSKFETSTSTSK